MRRAMYASLLAAAVSCGLTQTSEAAVYLNNTFSEGSVTSYGQTAFDVTQNTWVRNFTPTAGTISMTLKRTPTGGAAANWGVLSLICNSTAASDPGPVAGNYFRMVLPATDAEYGYTNFNLWTFASTATTDDITLTAKVSGSGNFEIRNDGGGMVARLTLGKDASSNMTVALGAATPVTTTALSTSWADLVIQTDRAANTFSASLNGTPIGSSTFVAGLGGGFRQLQVVPTRGYALYADELKIETAVVPEPATGAVALLGLSAIAMRRRRAR